MTPPRRTGQRTSLRQTPALLVGAAYYLAVAVVAFLGAVRATGLWSRSWELPLFYRSDALSGGSAMKATLETGWYESNPSLGAPHGLVMHPFPLADNMQFLVVKLIGLFTDQWSVAYNLAYLLTFPTAAITGTWFIRRCGVSRISAAALGLLFSAAPYHFMHGLPHLSLSMYFTVPLISWLAIAALTGRPIWSRRAGGHRWSPIRWLTPTTAATLLIAVLVGSTSSYYAVFGLIFLCVASVVALVGRRWRDAASAFAAGTSVVAVMLLNMAPDILWQRGHPASPAAFAREPLEAELYAFKFTSLIFPTHWNRVGDLGAWRFTYDETFPLPGERAALGLIASLGFLFLLALPLVVLARGRRPGGWWPSPLLSGLSVFTFVGLAFGLVGGLGTIFALVISPDIRAWNRIVIFVTLFGLTVAAMGLDRASTALGSRLRRWPRERAGLMAAAVAPVLALAVLAVGVFDQVAPSTWALIGDEQDRWDNDKAYVADIEDRVPAGTMVFELPAMAYPESLPINDMEDYELVRPYLHSHDLRWSYGAVKGWPRGDWTLTAAALPTERLVVALGAAGFGGIHVDRFGYPGHDTSALESQLGDLLDTEPIASPDGRFLFYDLAPFVDKLERKRSAAWLTRVGSHLVNPPTSYWQEDFNAPTTAPDGQSVMAGKSASPALDILNPRRASTEMVMAFTLRADGASQPVPVTVTWPDGKTDRFLVGAEGEPVRRRVEVPPGPSEVAFDAVGIPSLSLVGSVFEDPVLVFDTSSLTAAQQADDAPGGGRRG